MSKGFQFRRLYCGIRRSTALCITQHHTLDACFSFLLDILLEFSCQYFCTRHTPSFSLLNERPGDLFLPEVLVLVLAAFDRDIHWSGASPILIENQPADGFTGGSSVDVHTLKYTCCKQQHWTQTKRCTYTTFVTADRLYGKIEVDLLDQLVPYFRVKVGDMWLFDLDVSSILYSWTIRVAHLAKHLWTKTPHPFCRAILSKEGFLFGVRLFLPAGEVCSWRMAASLCACIEQSNKCTFVDLINALKEWDWKKNYRRRHDDFDLRRDGPCSWQHHILGREFAFFALRFLGKQRNLQYSHSRHQPPSTLLYHILWA